MQRLLVKNKPTSLNTGDVVVIHGENHVFGKYESKTKWVDSGENPDDWIRHFVIVNVTDALEGELDFLLEVDDEGNRLHSIPEQGEDSPYYDDLLNYAEVSVTKSQIIELM